jgi:two-component system, NarL family, invasion response regulator UvrY
VSQRILIIDDHPEMRRAVTEMLAEVLPGAVVQESATAGVGLTRAVGEAWDLVLLDLGLADRSGWEVLRELRRVRPALPVLVMSLQPAEIYGPPVVDAGATAYFAKGASADELAEAVTRALSGSPGAVPT